GGGLPPIPCSLWYGGVRLAPVFGTQPGVSPMNAYSFVSKWFGGGKRPAPSPAPGPRRLARARLALEALDERILLSVTEFPIPDTISARPEGITPRPYGNL